MEWSVERLAAMGHRTIAFFDAEAQSAEAKRRETTYRMALMQRDLPYHEHLLCAAGVYQNAQQQQDDVQSTLQRWMQDSLPPTGIIALSAERSIYVYQAANALGLDVPEDLSIIAITGLEFTGFHRARIASMRFQYEDVGHVAFETLLRLMDDKNTPPRHIYIPPKFIEGDTLRSPKR